ncbi:hypothetical protein Leryth_014868 [Lithospermum erythrorhizon]|nr:hypothetical protein Leryth_014868 [Lithospermum erythrorhizon]
MKCNFGTSREQTMNKGNFKLPTCLSVRLYSRVGKTGKDVKSQDSRVI